MRRLLILISVTLAPFLLEGNALGDTLILRDGTSIAGSLVTVTSNTIEFQDEHGASHSFKTSEIEAVNLSSGGKQVVASFNGAPRDTDPEERAPAAKQANESELIQQLLQRVAQLEATVAELKKPEPQQASTVAPIPSAAISSTGVSTQASLKEVSFNTEAASSLGSPPAPRAAGAAQEPDLASEGHTMQIPGLGPQLKIRGFFDFNFGAGQAANPLISPLGAPAHVTFQEGEFDLFITSQLSNTFNFLAETVIGADTTNEYSVDLERLIFQYKPSDYFQLSAGRYHTAIGYYNTAFHHGTWFQKATGRPYLFLFEDSGGILPVHSVGLSATGLVPKTGKLNVHWIAEVGNGRASNPNVQAVQNFLDEKDHKDFNLAFYFKPVWISGTQFGASYYRDRLVPTGLPHINQSISSVHAVYTTEDWEVLNEGVLIRNKPDGQNLVVNTPGFYSQISRRFGKNYWPYFRYQYINVPKADLVNPFVGRQDGPSSGFRWDFTNYAALKLQYNRLFQRGLEPQNGVDTQLAFTF
jgi:hypothetical protein